MLRVPVGEWRGAWSVVVRVRVRLARITKRVVTSHHLEATLPVVYRTPAHIQNIPQRFSNDKFDSLNDYEHIYLCSCTTHHYNDILFVATINNDSTFFHNMDKQRWR